MNLLSKSRLISTPADHTVNVFRMYDGDMETVELSCESDMMDAVLDRFGDGVQNEPSDEEILLKIRSNRPLDYERVCGAFQGFIKAQEEHNEKQIRMYRSKQLWLFLIGVAFIAAAIFLEGRLGSVFGVRSSIAGSFAIWEAANIWIVEKPKTQGQKRRLKTLDSAKITIE